MVRFLTRRFIGSYSSSVCCAYPHTVSLDNALWPIVVSVLKYFPYEQIFSRILIHPGVGHARHLPRLHLQHVRPAGRRAGLGRRHHHGLQVSKDKPMPTRASNEPSLKCDNHGKGLSQDLVKLEDHDQWSALRIYSNKPVPYDL